MCTNLMKFESHESDLMCELVLMVLMIDVT